MWHYRDGMFRNCWQRVGGRVAHGAVLLMSVVFSRAPLVAQATYSVFLARSPLPAEGAQPTQHDPASRVTLILRDSTVGYAVRALAQQAHLHPVYDYSNPRFSKLITVRVVNTAVMDAFAVILKGTGLAAQLQPDGETVLIHGPTTMTASSQMRNMTGVIVGWVRDSANGQALGGASVKVNGTTLGTVTSDSGHFTIKGVPSGDQVLSIRLFGYRPLERSVTVADSGMTTVRIVMVSIPTVLSGVVTTATGLEHRYNVGNDITVLNVDSIQRVAPISNITQMLETRVPGLVVQHTTGVPGAPSRLRVRGTASVNMSSDPIVIVDGVRIYADQSSSTVTSEPTNNGAIVSGSFTNVVGGGSNVGGFSGPSALDQIDPNSIETIEVLKGPSATAIYGSDAAAGVIIITTKRGHAGPTHWDLALDQGRTTFPGSWPTNHFLFGHNPDASWSNPRLSQICVFLSACAIKDSLVVFQALNDPRYSPLTGRPGHNQDASLTVSGGSNTLTYSVTGAISTESGYLHLPSIEVDRFQQFHPFPVPSWMRTPDQYSTYGASSQLTIAMGKKGGTLALNSSLFRSAQQQSSLQNDLINLSQMYVDTSQLQSTPLFSNYYTRAQLKTTTFTNALTLSNWSPWQWLPITATAGLNVQNLDNNTLLPRDYITCLGTSTDQNCGLDSLGTFALSQGANTSGSLTVGTVLAGQRLVSTAVGLNAYTLAQSAYTAQTTGLPIGVSIPTNFVYPSGSGPSYNATNSATYGWYVQPTLNLNSRFFASPGFRLDGGSNSGTKSGNSGGVLSFFPKLDVSWIAVQRSPTDPLFGALTLLRPRIAFGIAGIQPGPAQQLRLLQPTQVAPVTPSGAGTPIDVLQVQTLGNANLHPERDQELEGGLDAQFWNQRLSLTLTGYRKMAYDAILAVPVAPSILLTGTNSGIAENIGTIRNTGLEATVFTRLLDSRLVDWSVNANLSKNRNLLVSLAPGLLPITVQGGGTGGLAGYTTRLVPGFPLFGLWAPPIVGFYDANHNGLIDTNEVRVGDSATYIGVQQPNYELALGTTLTLLNGRVSINTAVDYQNGLTQVMSGLSNLNALVSAYLNPALPPAQQAALAAGLARSSDIGLLQTVNVLRWNTLSVSYLAPSHLAHLLHTSALSIALQGSNLALHSNYRGADPNVNAFAAGNLTTDSGTLLPQPRVWNLRITLAN